MRSSASESMKDRTFGDTATLDILTPATTHNSVGPHVYSSLFQYKPGYLKPSEKEIAGDVIESWEWAPDGLSVAMKLRQGVKFHNKPPVNGRPLDVDDVLFAWDRFSRLSSGRIGVARSRCCRITSLASRIWSGPSGRTKSSRSNSPLPVSGARSSRNSSLSETPRRR